MGLFSKIFKLNISGIFSVSLSSIATTVYIQHIVVYNSFNSISLCEGGAGGGLIFVL